MIQQGTFDDETVQQQADEYWETIRQQMLRQHNIAVSQYQATPSVELRNRALHLQRLSTALQESAQAGASLAEVRQQEVEDDSDDEEC